MAFITSSADRARIAYGLEPSLGTPPAPLDLKELRLTSSDLTAEKETAVSQELDASRNVRDLIETAASNGGSIEIEQSIQTYDDFIEAALAGTFSPYVNAIDLSLVALTGAVTHVGVAGFTDAVVGQYLYFGGFVNPGNNGWKEVLTVIDPDNITIPLAGLVDEALVTASARGKTASNGVVLRSFSVEQYFGDIDLAQLFLGQRVGTWSLSVEAGSIVTGSFALIGTETQTQTGQFANTITPPPSTPVLGATANVGQIEHDGAVLTSAIQSITFELDNGLRAQTAVGEKFAIGIAMGKSNITGSIVAYFSEWALYDQFLAHDNVQLAFDFFDNDNNRMRLFFPRVKFATADTAPSQGTNTDVLQNLDFQAILDPATGIQMQVDTTEI